jgi:hypothetical protein
MNAASTEPVVARGLTGTNVVAMPNSEALATLVERSTAEPCASTSNRSSHWKRPPRL